MINIIKIIAIILLLIYSIVLSILYWIQRSSLEDYQKERLYAITAKESELTKRESIVVDKEICFRELTKLKTIQNTALEVLKSYVITTPSQQEQELFSMVTQP
jgi:hypothetical protein